YVRPEILDGVLAGAEVLDVAVPADPPQRLDLGFAKKALFADRLEQQGSQACGEDFAFCQPLGVPGALQSALGADSDGRDDEVDVRMQFQVLSPCLHHAEEAA